MKKFFVKEKVLVSGEPKMGEICYLKSQNRFTTYNEYGWREWITFEAGEIEQDIFRVENQLWVSENKIETFLITVPKFEKTRSLEDLDDGGYKIKDGFIYLKNIDGKEIESKLIEITREDSFKIFDCVLKFYLKKFSKKEIYNNLEYLKFLKFDDNDKNQLRNYEIEMELRILLKNFQLFINEPCPFNGKYSMYGTVNNLINI